jgi:hypothetical protein
MPKVAKDASKRQKIDDAGDAMDDLFGDEDEYSTKIVAKIANTADELTGAVDTTLHIPEGRALAYKPGETNSAKIKILGSSHKSNENGPTSVKASAKILSWNRIGADIVREGAATAIMMTKSERVQTANGVDVNACLVATDTSPVLLKVTEVINLTLTLGKITQKGLKEKAVADLAAGAEVLLTDLKYQTSGVGVPWLTAAEWKVTEKAAGADGVSAAVATIAKSGWSLSLGAAVNSVAFRADAAPAPEMMPSFELIKASLASTKASMVDKLKAALPLLEESSDPLLFESNDQQIAPVLVFRKTKVASPANPKKGVLLNDAKLTLYLKRSGNGDALAELFEGGPIVASELGSERSFMETKLSGQMHVLPTKQLFIPTLDALKADSVFMVKHILAVTGPTLKVPLAVMAMPFGVNERATAELLMENVVPCANMVFMPAKAKIYTVKHGNPDYIQDVWIEPSQITIDARTTLRNVGLLLSTETVVSMYAGADYNENVPLSGESLLDMMGGDGHKPKMPRGAAFSISSLRETKIALSPSLEYYAVVPNMLKVAQGDGNIDCGTNSEVGDRLFLEAGGGSIDGCAAMLKKGELAVFAIKMQKATTAVETE